MSTVSPRWHNAPGKIATMTNSTLRFGPGQSVKKYSAQLPDNQTVFELPNLAGDADATVSLYNSDDEEVEGSVTVTAETVTIEAGRAGLVSRAVLIG